MSKYLLIGPCKNKKDASKTGGVIVLFEDLLFQFRKKNIQYIVIDTNKANYSNTIFAMLKIYLKILFNIFKIHHISLHGTAKDYIFIAPYVVFLSKVFSKKSSTRKFAGNFDRYYSESGILKKIIIEYVLKNSNQNFFETKYLVKYFQKFNSNTYWFPNVRQRNEEIKINTFNKKFVFISQLYKTKGVDEILEVSNVLDYTYTVDLYGPLKDEYTQKYFDEFKANYKGSLKPDEVLKTLSNYDVLILASYYPGEGYPGVIIEALSLGKPVIVTDLESIKEMVNESCAKFVKAKSSQEILAAIKSFDIENYKEYSKNALLSFGKFDSDIQTSIFLERLNA